MYLLGLSHGYLHGVIGLFSTVSTARSSARCAQHPQTAPAQELEKLEALLERSEPQRSSERGNWKRWVEAGGNEGRSWEDAKEQTDRANRRGVQVIGWRS